MGADAAAVARYIHDTFYSREAWARLHPARVELVRLTNRQYVNTVADLLKSFGAADATALVPVGGKIATVEGGETLVPPGLTVVKQAMLAQMVLERPTSAEPVDFLDLGDADAPEMVALATLTEPGPFVEATHRLGEFIGIRIDGQLVAMSGERMRAPGLTEVSAVCTHPDWRGRGLAGKLMRVVMARIVARGETPFLHSYASNSGAIALYEKLGFRVRREVIATFMERQA